MNIPAYNEAPVIGRVICELRQVRPDLDVVVIDDGSRDTTAAVADETGVPAIRLPYNLGVGGAMRAGFKYAASCDYSYAIQLDADGQHDPRSIANLEAALFHADVVVGSRFVNEDSHSVRGPHRWMMHLLRLVASRICRTRISDTTSGFRGSSKAAEFQIAKVITFYPRVLSSRVSSTLSTSGGRFAGLEALGWKRGRPSNTYRQNSEPQRLDTRISHPQFISTTEGRRRLRLGVRPHQLSATL